MMIVRFSILLLLWATLLPFVHGADLPQPIAPPPIPPSPIEDFRRWLTMDPVNREKELAAYPEEKRVVLRRKIEAYEAMRPADRDVRLQLLELRWYLPPLMSVTGTNRGNYLDIIPPHLHEAIKARLKHWDNLSEKTRQEILTDQKKREMATRYYVLPRRTVIAPPPFPADQTPASPQLQAHFRRWEDKSPSARAKISAHLSNFLQLPKDEQQEALNAFSEAERQEMQKTLDAFAELTPEARRACVDSFQKFATMSREERASFLRNATRWQQLTPQERRVWREIVENVPPIPPIPFPLAPMPAVPRSNLGNGSVASTNRSAASLN